MSDTTSTFLFQVVPESFSVAEPVWASEAFMVAVVGFLGVLVGSFASIASNIASEWYRRRAEERREQPMKRLLLQMLSSEKFSWRELDTLMHVIGADEATTKRLLLELNARGSEDGERVWGLISRNPLP